MNLPLVDIMGIGDTVSLFLFELYKTSIHIHINDMYDLYSKDSFGISPHGN